MKKKMKGVINKIMPNDTYIPTKNDLKEILNLLRIREFIVSCSLDYDNNLSYSDKLLLSKYFVSREYTADQVRISRRFQNENDESIYMLLLECEDIKLHLLLNILFEDEKNLDNCIKKMKMHYDDFDDFMAKELKYSRGEKLNNMVFLFLNEKYGDDMFLYFKDK